MQDTLQKIMAILEAQGARITALEKQLELYTGGTDTLIDTVYNTNNRERFNSFSDKHRSKFEPYIGIMDKLEGGDSFRAIYEKSFDVDGEEGYNEDTYVDGVLTNIIETIESLKSVVPPEAAQALEQAEAAIQTAAIENDQAEITNEAESTNEDDEWSEENLAKEKLGGVKLFSK